MIRPDFKEFSRLARTATLVPVAKSISADLLTPVSAFLAVAADEPNAFLLESVEGGEKIGRYTFLGVRPFLRLESHGDQITIRRDPKANSVPTRIPKIETRAANISTSSRNSSTSTVPHRSKDCRPLPPAPSAIAPTTSSASWKTLAATPRMISTSPTAF